MHRMGRENIDWHEAVVQTYDSGVVFLVTLEGVGLFYMLGSLNCALGCLGACRSKYDKC